jgi:hypothetical protein
MFVCVELGSRDNPCRCKVIGPTLGAVVGAVSALLFWPVGAVTYCVSRTKGRVLLGQPVHVYTATKDLIPI